MKTETPSTCRSPFSFLGFLELLRDVIIGLTLIFIPLFGVIVGLGWLAINL